MDDIQRGYVYEQMIYEIVQEIDNDIVTCVDIINNIAASLDTQPDEIVNELLAVDSPFPKQIVGFIEKEPIKYRTYNHTYNKALAKIAKKVKIENDDETMCMVDTIHCLIDKSHTKLKWKEV